MGACLCACLPRGWCLSERLRLVRTSTTTSSTTTPNGAHNRPTSATTLISNPCSVVTTISCAPTPSPLPRRNSHSVTKATHLTGDGTLPVDGVVDALVVETLANVRLLVDVDQEPPRSMLALHVIAEQDESGWQRVVVSLLKTVPLSDPLGPAVILLLLDDSPLPTKEMVLALVEGLGLSGQFASDNSHRHMLLRNVCVTLGCLSEKMARINAVALLTDAVLDFLIQLLVIQTHTLVSLFAVIAVEKFSQTSENKLRINSRLNAMQEHPLLRLEKFCQHEDFEHQQLGLCSQWCLDNIFSVEGRSFAFTSVDYSRINAMLNTNDTSRYLKITPDGLQARCDASSFESVRCTFCVNKGCWYYEAIIVTGGVMQIGWASKSSRFLNYEGFGIGDDGDSVAYDGCRCLIWHGARARSHAHRCWRPGDVLGALIDLSQRQCVFSLNGDALPPFTEIFNTTSGEFYAAASFMSFQQCRFNFGRDPFRFPPKDRPFRCFNDHASLPEHQRPVLPKLDRLAQLRQCSVAEDACTLCYDNTASITLQPCTHSGFCPRCAANLEQCPLCRAEISDRT